MKAYVVFSEEHARELFPALSHEDVKYIGERAKPHEPVVVYWHGDRHDENWNVMKLANANQLQLNRTQPPRRRTG